MSEIKNKQNLESHYSTNTKTQRPERPIVSGPENLPAVHVFNDIDANKRLKAINQDIYIQTKKEEKKEIKNFAKFFAIFVALIVGLKGITKLFKKS